MKTLQLKKMGKSYPLNFLISRKIIAAILISLIFAGFQATAQLPTVTVRFANPQYDCDALTYCLDVEFQSDTPDQQLFGMNVRFYYDDNVLEYLSMGDFVSGYGPVSPNPPIITTGNASSGPTLFGFVGPAEFLNGAVQLISTTSVYLSTTGWTKIFKICFQVDDPNGLNNSNFCPSVVWDLEEDPANGGFLPGDEGVVISVVAPPPAQSTPAIAHVVQFNWQYDGIPGTPYGVPVNETCISTICVSPFEYADAPEGVLAYPDINVMGAFPTCVNVPIAGFISHGESQVFFGPMVDYEFEGNGGICSSFNPYDNDELAFDPDAGLIIPSAFSINPIGQYIPITPPPEVKFGYACDTSYWGINADIMVHNHSGYLAFVNVLADWSQDGTWNFDPFCTCYGSQVPEHILVNLPVPPGFDGPISALIPPGASFRMGPKDGYVWVRFSITEVPVQPDWTGEGEFQAGETEDYLLYVNPPGEIPLANWSVILTIVLIAGATLYIWRRRIS